MLEDPSPIEEMLASGAMYGYKRATKSGMEPILVLNLRKALD